MRIRTARSSSALAVFFWMIPCLSAAMVPVHIPLLIENSPIAISFGVSRTRPKSPVEYSLGGQKSPWPFVPSAIDFDQRTIQRYFAPAAAALVYNYAGELVAIGAESEPAVFLAHKDHWPGISPVVRVGPRQIYRPFFLSQECASAVQKLLLRRKDIEAALMLDQFWENLTKTNTPRRRGK